MEYLTPDDYEIARKNGISRKVAYNRFYLQNWNRERSITEPLQIHKWTALYNPYKEVSVVSMRTFQDRVSRGWHPKKAATAPLRRNQNITKEMISTAAQNGIKECTFRQRIVVYKWSVERAMTEPIHENLRRKAQDDNARTF
jgi:hypothetical protein